MHDMAAHGALYMAHGYCLLWKPWLVTLHVGSDALTAAAYFAIPFAIAAFVRRRGVVRFQPLAWLFVAFIALCGLTHVFSAVTLWYPIYEFEGVLKAVTAAVSIATAIVMFPLIPRALAMPRAEDLAAANERLAQANDEKSRMLAELERVRMELEARVQQRTAELAAANARLTSALRGSGIVVFEQDGDLRYSWVMEHADDARKLLGHTDAELHPPEIAVTLERVKRTAMVERSSGVTEVELDLAGKYGVWALWVEPRFDAAGSVNGVVCVAVDVTQRRENEERMRDVMHELSHRSKNLLAIVAAIANQTARTTDGVTEFRERFLERLQSLAATHDALVASDWFGADLASLVQAQLQPYQRSYAECFDVAGPEVTLSPHASQYVALALHELAANATKHGALARGRGVQLRWHRSPSGELELEWREDSDRPIEPFKRRGFGWILLDQLVPRAVGGDCKFELRGTQLVYRLTLGRSHLLDTPH